MSLQMTIEATVVPGHGVASGASVGSKHNPYPAGSIALQAPFFQALGLDLSDCFLGTLNLSIAPFQWRMLKADYCFERLQWTHLHPPETFSFLRLQILSQDVTHTAWLYLPHPETKAQHFQPASMMEVIAPHLPGVSTGQRLDLRLPEDGVQIYELTDPT